MSRRGAIFGLTVFLLVAAQCFALCSVMPCSVPVQGSCHHEAPDNAPCAHEGFVTEGASKSDVTPAVVASSLVLDAVLAQIAEISIAPPDPAAPNPPSISVLRI